MLKTKKPDIPVIVNNIKLSNCSGKYSKAPLPSGKLDWVMSIIDNL